LILRYQSEALLKSGVRIGRFRFASAPQASLCAMTYEDLPSPRPLRKRTIVLSVIAAGGIASGGAYAYAATGSSSGSPSAAAPSAASPSSSSSTQTSWCPAGPSAVGNDFDGLITAVSSNSVTVRSLFGTTRTYAFPAKTSVHEGPQTTVKISALRAGEHVHVRGTKSSSRYTATDIDVHPATIDGRVTGISSSALTVTDPDGFTRTIATDSDTTYTSNGKSASRSAITSGSVVHAQGQVDENGTSLDADNVAKLTASSAPGGGPAGPRPGRLGTHAGPRAPGPGCGPMGGPGHGRRDPGGAGGAAPSGAPKPPSGTPSSIPTSAGSS
jgi:hypothetical protein